MERMKRVEDLDVSTLGTQGIVGGWHHPHVHCVVPAGGLSPDGSRWIPCRPKFFLPVRVLSRLFRGKLLAWLRQAFAEGTLRFFGQLADLARPARFHAWLRKSKKTEWVVYAKPPFGGPVHVLKYLARYTHRVAISSSRLLSLDHGRVTFRWRDSRHGNHTKSMTLDAAEFIRRFLLHILSSGFVKIRHFGSMTFSPDGRRMIVASWDYDHAFELWALENFVPTPSKR
jgi:hypothetical protein